jgi:RNA polymerase sigma-70 factor (ECF subfamily)
MTSQDASVAVFDRLRPKLIRVAYRMLGSVADAEDIVQEAFLRWRAVEPSEVREPEAYLRRVVTRLALDLLKSARKRREVYVGPWLPEPMMEVEAETDLDDITLPLMLALERLSPLERAAFLLHDVFGVSFDEIAGIIDRQPATCRQLASRARIHVRGSRPRFETSKARGLAMAQAFFTASRSGDMTGLQALLAEDVALYADGGGIRSAALRTIIGLDDVMKVQTAIAARLAKIGPSELLRYGLINGLPGFITREPDGLVQTTAFLIEEGQITAIYIMRNPEKLRHLEGEGR